MKKEYIIVILIFFLIIIGYIATQKSVENFFDNINNKLENLEENLLSSKLSKEDLKKEIDGIQQEWENKYKVLGCYIEHDELEKIGTELAQISACIKVQDYNKAIINLGKCKFIVEDLKNKDSFKLVNVF